MNFDRSRIERVMEKAFIATAVAFDDALLTTIADDVVMVLEKKFNDDLIPSVEDVQDVVEQQLIAKGFLVTAKAYIIYRKEREKFRSERQLELLEKIEKRELKVVKRDGKTVDFDVKEVERAINNCCEGLDFKVDIEGVVRGSKHNIYDGISTKEINQAVLMSLKSYLEKDPIYSKLAARFLFNDLYKDVLGVDEFSGEFDNIYRSNFSQKVVDGVTEGRLSKRLLEYDLGRLALNLKPERDRLFEYMGAQVLYDRYFLHNSKNEILEVPQYFWMRVAMGIALNEKDKEERALEFYNLISRFLYVPSTPTLLHSGTYRPQMSSCYLTTVEDDLDHIFKCIGDNAQLARWSGGVANDWSNIRGTGALIKSINVPSQGVVPFLKIADSTTAAINRSGKRRGATCVYLEVWHFDFEEFLDLRKNTGDERRRTHDTNTAAWIPDLFMKRVLKDEEWMLFSPDETPDLHHIYGDAFEKRYKEYEKKAARGEMVMFKKIKAKNLWRKMITILFEAGHPWFNFKDSCNIRSPQDHVGVVHCSNLCTEITLNTSADETAVCNLGSVCIWRHIVAGVLDKELLGKTVTTAMRMLDNVIDINFYPTKEAAYSNLRHRPVGLGIMGLQDGFFKLGLQFDTPEAVNFSDELMEFISFKAILTSSLLAKERGAYSSYKGSKWDRDIFPIDTIRLLEKERGEETGLELRERLSWAEVRETVKKYGMRNSNCLAIAPTATIGNISASLPSIEPIYKNLYVKSNFSGEFTIINSYLVEELKANGLWNDELLDKIKYHDGSIQRIEEIPLEIRGRYKEAFEIDPYWVVLHAAYRGKWIDQSQSINIFTRTTSGNFISDVYFNAWRLGLKTTYYLRSLGASAIEKSTLDINKDFETKKEDLIASFVPEADKAVPTASRQEGEIHVFEDAICESCQ